MQFIHLQDYRRIERLIGSLEQHMAHFGYEKRETPLIQPADLFLTRAGDQIITRLFTFERHGQTLALRPEFTASAARAYLDPQTHSAGVVRWQFSGAVFEENVGGGEFQRLSLGAELIGLGGAVADAEIIALAAQGVALQGIRDGELILGHVGLMRHLLGRFGIDSRTQRFLLAHLPALRDPAQGPNYVRDALDRLLGGVTVNPTESDDGLATDMLLDSTERGLAMGGRTRQDIARRLLQKRQRAAEREQVSAALDFLDRWNAVQAPAAQAFAAMREHLDTSDSTADAMLNRWARTIQLLDQFDIPSARVTLQPALARDWEYYSGLVFELRAGERHVGGGGRYDELTRLLGGAQEVPAVGFAYYLDQLLAALPAPASEPDRPLSMAFDEGAAECALRWASRLRARGCSVALIPAASAPADALRPTTESVAWRGRVYYGDDLDALLVEFKEAL